ncbi:ABC transporter permease [Reyranella sp.]|jgi:NitT/TauT family transport system permease protein|uniref:ABC transporter permease n=1 Tax=Reyranella sp. TaxID=1929291 RepID=UPI002F945049
MKRTLLGSLGIALFLALWQAIGQFKLAGISWPPLSAVLDMLSDASRLPLFRRALSATLASTAVGYAWGMIAGLALATLAHLLPWLRRGSDRLAAVLNSVPSIALGPIFLVLLSRDSTPAAVSSIHVFFIVFVSTSSGLQRASAAHRDLFEVLGADRLERFFRLEFPAALPPLVSGLRLAWPAALIGAIIGEWFGASRGIGILIINAMQNFQIVLLWCAVMLAVVASLFFYGLLTIAERAAYARFG